jgi:short-subunit dehydrogenase
VKPAFVITGGSKGLGKEIARVASQKGYPIALVARDNNALEKAKAEIETVGKERVSSHAADLGDATTAKRAFEEIVRIHGGIQTLVNNAGTWRPRKSSGELTVDDVMASFQLNFLTAFNAVQETLSLRKKNPGIPLAIINIGATASLRGGIQTAPFSIAKSALRIFSQSLAKELGPQGIHVAHLIIDGMIDNERTRGLNVGTEGDRFMNPTAIANSILQISEQERSAWTFEWDMRPFNEKW